MPLILESHDSLPYIDAPLNDAERASITALVAAEMGEETTTLHPSIPSGYTPRFSALMEAEHASIVAGRKKLTALDLSRYEEIEAPENTDPNSDESRPELLRAWNQALRKAYASSTYLSSRLTNLGLLEKYGKNAWLISNSQLESILKDIEVELSQTRAQLETVEELRRSQQASVAGEMGMLESSWKTGVGRMIETEIAAEGLRHDILEKQRATAA